MLVGEVSALIGPGPREAMLLLTPGGLSGKCRERAALYWIFVGNLVARDKGADNTEGMSHYRMTRLPATPPPPVSMAISHWHETVAKGRDETTKTDQSKIQTGVRDRKENFAERRGNSTLDDKGVSEVTNARRAALHGGIWQVTRKVSSLGLAEKQQEVQGTRQTGSEKASRRNPSDYARDHERRGRGTHDHVSQDEGLDLQFQTCRPGEKAPCFIRVDSERAVQEEQPL
ncbi:hypothetical protein AAFF_G00148520 [Aldrovandia affinis]|uniref:Uncharacterized protein n=1 Tax=Aldrovandia affinis TaxID=143900 RepID=A0AAD7RPS9_9TELE|nr:hypothetical protein AAFF_G00148520 [Aldrovandia affinis]